MKAHLEYVYGNALTCRICKGQIEVGEEAVVEEEGEEYVAAWHVRHGLLVACTGCGPQFGFQCDSDQVPTDHLVWAELVENLHDEQVPAVHDREHGGQLTLIPMEAVQCNT